ncbi:MAG TPA: TetR/AcrR family transcriptional regulator [Candidatus Ornithoclostridium faecigallinarum]|nr:TetR/AcrR family transcriptional regulator [Candidatus Ornithoclostridium faecigallinarum]
MEYSPDEYTRHYIVTALFKLMHEYEYEKIKVTDIVAKAGVGRATFYRYFKSKEDVIIYYFERHTREFVFEQRIIPRGKEDHIKIAFDTLTMFKQNKEPFKLLQKAHLTDLYLDYLNKRFAQNFERDNKDSNRYLPYLYAGMLYNVSMKWLEDDCKEDAQTLATMIVEAIYDKGDKE